MSVHSRVGVAVGLSVVSTAMAQLDRVVQDASPSFPGGATMRTSYGIAGCVDGGAAIIGGDLYNVDGVSLIRVKPSGDISWERRFSVPPSLAGGVGSSVVETTDQGFALVAMPEVPPLWPNPYRLGVLRVNASGEVLWGHMARVANDIDPVGHKQWDAPRVRELPDRSVVATGVNSAMFPSICRPAPEQDKFDTGVILKVGSNGRPVFAREYGEAGYGRRSHVAFTDIAVSPSGMFVLGSIRSAGDCTDCGQDIDGLLVWMDFNGNPLKAWSFDSPIDPEPTPECPRTKSTEWGAGLAVSGQTVFFSMATSMSYSASGEALVGRFDVGTGTLQWSGRIKDLWPMYHCVELSSPSGNVLVGGHRPVIDSFGAGAALVVLKPTTGGVLSANYYQDPRSFSTGPLFTLRGIAASRNDRAWLTNGGLFGGPGEVYYRQVDAAGASACSAIADPRDSQGEALKVIRRSISVVGNVEVVPWKPESQKVNSVALDPCRR